MQIRAAVLRSSPVAKPYAETKPLTIEPLTLAPPGRDAVLVKVAAAGLCAPALAGIGRARPPWCWATRRPAWWRSSARASTTSPWATTW